MVATSSDTYGDTPRYVIGREVVLGRRVIVPEDPAAAAEVLAEIHGGPRRAASWLRAVLRQIEERRS